MRYALIKGGIVDNVIVADDDFITDGFDNILISDDQVVNIGDGYKNGKFIRKEEPGMPINLVPHSITKRQAMLQLNKVGLYDSTIEFINAADNKELRIEFDFTPIFERSHPFIGFVANQFNLSDDQVDQLFIDASTL